MKQRQVERLEDFPHFFELTSGREERVEVVLALLRGEEKLEVLARRHGICANTLRRYRDEFVAGARARLMRKNSFHNMSKAGALTHSTLMAVLRTLKRRGYNPVDTLVEALPEYVATGALPPVPQRLQPTALTRNSLPFPLLQTDRNTLGSRRRPRS